MLTLGVEEGSMDNLGEALAVGHGLQVEWQSIYYTLRIRI